MGKEEVLDNWWQKLLTVMVEEETSLVNGVMVSKRKKRDKMAAWLSNVGQSEEVLEVGRLVKDKLRVEDRFQFIVHKEATLWGRKTILWC